MVTEQLLIFPNENSPRKSLHGTGRPHCLQRGHATLHHSPDTSGIQRGINFCRKNASFFFQIFRWGRIPWGFCFKHSDGQVFGRLGNALFWVGFPFTSICCFNRVGNHSLVLVGCEESPLGAQYGAHVEWYRSIIAPSSLITTKMLLDIPSCFVADILDWRFKWLMICVFLPFHLTNFLTFPFLSMPKSYQLALFDPPLSRVSSSLPRL